MSFLINPYAFLAAGGDFEPIATVTVGSGGASSIEFTSIPGTYQHLQVRMIGRDTRASRLSDGVNFRINGDAGSNYTTHLIEGDSSSAYAIGYASIGQMYFSYVTAANAAANIFGASIIDILDYADTSKYTTVRKFGGVDNNGSIGSVGEGCQVGIRSGVWRSTSAVTSMSFTPSSGNFAQYTTAALYGVKA